MPHVIVKMYSGRTEEQKQKLAEAVTKAVMSATGIHEFLSWVSESGIG